MIKLTPFHPDIVDIHDSNVTYMFYSCMFLFCSPKPDGICTCWFIYFIECCQAEHGPRKRLLVAFRYSIDCMICELWCGVLVLPMRGNPPKSTSFFQFASFMWLSMTFLRCNVNIPLVLLEISFSGAQSISIVSPSICWLPSMKLGEYLARQVSWCPCIWKSPMPNLSSRPSGILRYLLPATLSFIWTLHWHMML